MTDAGTTEEKLHFAGGYNAANGWSSTVQSLSGTESFTYKEMCISDKSLLNDLCF